MASPPIYKLGAIHQVSIVVSNLERAMGNYWTQLGIGPWSVYTYCPPRVKDPTYYGKPVYFKMRLALAHVGGMLFELLEPVEGPTIARDFLEKHGEGIHHFGYFVPSLHRAIQEMTALGFQIIQSGWGHGKQGDGGFAFLGTEQDLGAIFEIIEVPVERMDPDYIFPDQYEQWQRRQNQ